jgi:4-hydroxy-tetrahydrodipicolinate reductase
LSADRLRVVQWATGNIGGRALREVVRHPALELVGVLVYDSAKAGVDAGTLCGEGPTGVTATTDRDAIHALEADCVLYMPRHVDVDDVVAFLEAGTNVVTTRGEFFDDGAALPDATRVRVVEACARGNSSVYSTGSSPGFITDALPFALLSLQRRVDRIEIDEYANMSQRDSPHLLFEQMGYGRPPTSFSPRRAEYLLGEFGPALHALATAAGRVVDAWSSEGKVALARHDTHIAAGDLAAGTVAAQRTTLVGTDGGEPVVQFRANWYVTDDVEPAWDLRPTGWRVSVHGDAPLAVDLPFPVPLEDLGAFTPGYTAHRPVNAVPYVCAAAPGILATADLPPFLPAGPRRS